MPSFRFQARDRNGAATQGERDAVSAGVLLEELRGEGLLPLKVEAVAESRVSARVPRWIAPAPQDVELALRQLAFMVRSGVPLLEALKISVANMPNRRIAGVLEDVGASIREGTSLAEAMGRHRCFDALTRSLIEVGEQGGHLDTVLERAAVILERKRFLRTQMVTALIYPALVVVLAVATVAYMMVGVIPKLATFLTALGRQLPPSTQLLVDVSDFVEEWYHEALFAVVAVCVVTWIVSKTRAGRAFLDLLIVRTPIVGRIVGLAAVSAFTNNLALLVRSGVMVTQGLAVIEPVLPLDRFSRQVARARNSVIQGFGLSESLERARAFDPIVTGMIAVGESSGRLDEVLEHTAEYHDGRLRDLIRRLGTIIEPVILVIVGLVVGFVYLSFFSAVYQFAGNR